MPPQLVLETVYEMVLETLLTLPLLPEEALEAVVLIVPEPVEPKST